MPIIFYRYVYNGDYKQTEIKFSTFFFKENFVKYLLTLLYLSLEFSVYFTNNKREKNFYLNWIFIRFVDRYRISETIGRSWLPKRPVGADRWCSQANESNDRTIYTILHAGRA